MSGRFFSFSFFFFFIFFFSKKVSNDCMKIVLTDSNRPCQKFSFNYTRLFKLGIFVKPLRETLNTSLRLIGLLPWRFGGTESVQKGTMQSLLDCLNMLKCFLPLLAVALVHGGDRSDRRIIRFGCMLVRGPIPKSRSEKAVWSHEREQRFLYINVKIRPSLVRLRRSY